MSLKSRAQMPGNQKHCAGRYDRVPVLQTKHCLFESHNDNAGTGHRISGKYADLLKRQTCPVYKIPCHRVLKKTAPAALFYSSVTDISAPFSGAVSFTSLSPD